MQKSVDNSDILEVMSSTNLNSFGDVNLVFVQDSLIHKKAMKIYLVIII